MLEDAVYSTRRLANTTAVAQQYGSALSTVQKLLPYLAAGRSSTTHALLGLLISTLCYFGQSVKITRIELCRDSPQLVTNH